MCAGDIFPHVLLALLLGHLLLLAWNLPSKLEQGPVKPRDLSASDTPGLGLNTCHNIQLFHLGWGSRRQVFTN